MSDLFFFGAGTIIGLIGGSLLTIWAIRSGWFNPTPKA